jgi:phage terminase small subunit
MSGHNKWTQIKRQKGTNDAKRSKIFAKLSKAITLAAKNSGDPDANPTLKLAIDKAKAERSRRTGINQDRVLQEIARCAFVNPLDFINPGDATIRDDVSQDDAAAIASVKVKVIPTEDGNIVEREIKLVPKDKMLELAGKHLGMYVERHQIVEAPKIVDDV